jgi:hypothetical protein
LLQWEICGIVFQVKRNGKQFEDEIEKFNGKSFELGIHGFVDADWVGDLNVSEES